MRDRKAIIQRAIIDSVISASLSAIICVVLLIVFRQGRYQMPDLYETLFYAILIPMVIVPIFSVRNSRLVNQLIELNEKLEDVSAKDVLTEVLNRRGFFRKAEPFVKYAQRYNREYSFIIIDIDYFKRINDAYGYPFGDKVLKELAFLLRLNLRETDVLGRLGGEEFGIFLPEINLNDTLVVVERLRKIISGQLIAYNEKEIKVTASIGICIANTKGISTIYDVYNFADIALYTAKLNGRDRYEVYVTGSSVERT